MKELANTVSTPLRGTERLSAIEEYKNDDDNNEVNNITGPTPNSPDSQRLSPVVESSYEKRGLPTTTLFSTGNVSVLCCVNGYLPSKLSSEIVIFTISKYNIKSKMAK
jgi:hypothetical protein